MNSNGKAILILSSTTNEQGERFTELAASYFNSLGYEKCRFDIHKSGREIDIEGKHVTEEDRVLIAECKATNEKIGGADINKFIGALDAEKRARTSTVVGYYLSLSGFTQTAIEQERQIKPSRVVLEDGEGIVKQLIKGRVIVGREEASLAAGQVAAQCSSGLNPEFPPVLIAHQTGFIWTFFFSENKKVTHVALIHADGTPLHSDVAAPILAHPEFAKGLIYLSPLPDDDVSAQDLDAAKTSYFAYLEAECGEIQLEGLPADQEVGSRRLRLESIFVPSHLIPLRMLFEEQTQSPAANVDSNPEDELVEEVDEEDEDLEEDELSQIDGKRIPAGQILSLEKRIAILGLPGSGKSTLLKRISTAYAFSDRMKLVNDGLPHVDHFPIFIRCRQLKDRARAPILDLLQDITKRAEMPSHTAEAFSVLIQESMRRGRALLLVDGLDEISESGDRVAFVSQLRTFLHRYPSVGLVVTSRQAGFRVVGSALSTVCGHYALADFDEADINQLTIAWHKEVVGNRPEVLTDAEELGRRICSIPRVRQLAGNPLLLTTLLLVRRWVGSLPTKRSILYAKAIEVLLATWNVEGHAPLDQEEVVPQLEYLAFTMMRDGIQQIGLDPLRRTLIESRTAMPEILSYTKVGPTELIDRIELRSSLLMQSGMGVIDGKLMPVYEFRHLTFQEFLCAQAVGNGHYPGAKEGDTPLSVLQPFMKQESWRETVLLAMVLLGKRTAPIVRFLLQQMDNSNDKETRSSRTLWRLVLDALVDEIQIPPDLFEESLRKLLSTSDSPSDALRSLYHTRYRESAYHVARVLFFDEGGPLLRAGSLIANFAMMEHLPSYSKPSQLSEHVSNFLRDKITEASSTEALATTFLLIMEVAYMAATPRKHDRASAPPAPVYLKQLVSAVCFHFTDDRIQVSSSALWAFNWLNDLAPDAVTDTKSIFNWLYRSALNEPNQEKRYLLHWAMSTFSSLERDSFPLGTDAGEARVLFEQLTAGSAALYPEQEKRTALVIAYYMRLLPDKDLLDAIENRTAQFDRHLDDIKSILKARLASPLTVDSEMAPSMGETSLSRF